MRNFRVDVSLHYSVPDDTDEDQFHDDMRDNLDAGVLHTEAYRLDLVGTLDVTEEEG